jgi:hypothetical protein
MLDIISRLQALHRPRLLMRAARIGSEDYRRDVHLQRVLGVGPVPRHGSALMRLLEIEGDLNDKRKSDDADYSLITHVDVLIAMVAEARILHSMKA